MTVYTTKWAEATLFRKALIVDRFPNYVERINGYYLNAQMHTGLLFLHMGILVLVRAELAAVVRFSSLLLIGHIKEFSKRLSLPTASSIVDATELRGKWSCRRLSFSC